MFLAQSTWNHFQLLRIGFRMHLLFAGPSRLVYKYKIYVISCMYLFVHLSIVQAFIINEFEGETFSCSGGATFQCLKTGNDVISSLSFQDQSLGRSILGLGCCTMVFLLLAVFFLMNNRLTFLPMNHVGRNIRGLQCKDESDTSEKQSLPSIPVEEGR